MRVLVRTIALLLGLAVAAGGVVTVLEIAWTRTPGDRHLLVDWRSLRDALSAVSWSDTSMRVTASIVVVAGLALILIAARSGHKHIRLHDPAEGVMVVTAPRSLARYVGHRVREQDAIARASVVASKRKVRVKARSELTEIGDQESSLRAVTGESIDELPLVDQPKVSVAVRAAKNR